MVKQLENSNPSPLLANRWLWGGGYLLMLVGIVAGLFQVRHWTAVTFDNESAVSQWQEWRTDVINQPTDAPVTRRTPKSETPPAFVLLHKYFAVCMTLSVVLCSALYLTFMAMIRGAILSPGTIRTTRR